MMIIVAISMVAIVPTEYSAAIVIKIPVIAPSALMGIGPINRTTLKIPITKPETLMPKVISLVSLHM